MKDERWCVLLDKSIISRCAIANAALMPKWPYSSCLKVMALDVPDINAGGGTFRACLGRRYRPILDG